MKNLAWLHKLPSLWPWFLGLVLTLVVLYIAALVGYRLLQWRRLLRRKATWLEITPPLTASKSARANQELINILYGFRSSRSFRDKLLKREVVMTLQVLSTREYGIRYMVQTEKRLAATLSQAITSYLPETKVKEVQVEFSRTDMQVIEFKQIGHYAFPLAPASVLEDNDPIAYLTGMMTKLSSGEQMSFQIVLKPVRLREASAIAHRILRNDDLLYHLSGRRLPLFSQVGNLLNKAMYSATDMIGEVYNGSMKGGGSYDNAYGSARSNYERVQIANRQRPTRSLSAFEQEIMESMHSKLNQPLFRVSIRASVSMADEQAARDRLTAIKTSLQAYNAPSYQALHARVSNPYINRLRRYAFTHQLPSFFYRHAPVLSSSEIASLYHFPAGGNAKTDNLATSLSRTLAAPISLKQGKELDVLIGENEHHGIFTSIGLTDPERERHVYIIGGTGNGKTTLLQYAIVQDMKNGKGLAVVDPHGDMAEAMLTHVPPERASEVIYFNPDDLAYPIGLNLLELTEGLEGDDLLREKDLITESVISVFRKIFSEEDTGGHRIEYVLRNTIQTALTVPDATLFTVYDLLNDADYRKRVIKTLEDRNLKNFWKNELGKAGDMQKVKMSAGITAKIGRFLFSASAKRILEQPKSTIDFDDIINSGKILICNFSKGLIGEDTSELFGITVLAKLQLASLRRARLKQSERRAFYLYVDEFQNFATQSFVQMLSESRKYKLFMNMAEQSTSQQKDQKMIDIILANVGTVICFRTGNPQDERLLLPLFSPYIEQGEINNLPSFNFYAKLSAVNAQEPLSGKTVLLTEKGHDEVAVKVVKLSRQKFAKKAEPIETTEQPTPIPDRPSTKRQQNTKGSKIATKQTANAGMLDE